MRQNEIERGRVRVREVRVRNEVRSCEGGIEVRIQEGCGGSASVRRVWENG